MATLDHPSFKQPIDKNISVWRYMSFARFVWMVQNQCLYFRRIDKFDDKYEGQYTKVMANSREQKAIEFMAQQKVYNPNYDLGQAREHIRSTEVMQKNHVLEMFINCWHSNKRESAAIWKLYTSLNESVCIKTNYLKLADHLSKEIMLGELSYIDYDEDIFDTGNVFNHVLHKRESFAHEKEIRAVYWMDKRVDHRVQIDQSGFGLPIEVNMAALVEEIYVSPDSSNEFRDVVAGIAKT